MKNGRREVGGEEWKEGGKKLRKSKFGKNDSADRNINRDEKGDIVRKKSKEA